MSDQVLLKNAIEVLTQPNGLEKVRENIKGAEYHFGLITDKNVFLENLIWMGHPEDWRPHTSFATKEGKVYEKIAPKGESRSLKSVAERIRSKYSSANPELDTPEQLLTALYQESDWFGPHLSLSTRFDPLLLSPLWVRSTRHYEKGECERSRWQDTLYIEDGNHRALVYAMRILCEVEEFIPVPIIWCQSWEHIYCWAVGPEEAEPAPPSKLKKYFEHWTADKYLFRFFDNRSES